MFISVRRFSLVGEDECGKYDLVDNTMEIAYQQKDREGSLGGKVWRGMMMGGINAKGSIRFKR